MCSSVQNGDSANSDKSTPQKPPSESDWEIYALHVQGTSKAKIARLVDVHRNTVAAAVERVRRYIEYGQQSQDAAQRVRSLIGAAISTYEFNLHVRKSRIAAKDILSNTGVFGKDAQGDLVSLTPEELKAKFLKMLREIKK